MNGLRSTHGSVALTVSWVSDELVVENVGTAPARHLTVAATTPDVDLTYEIKVAELGPGAGHRLQPDVSLTQVPELRVRLRWWDGGLRTRSLEGTVRRIGTEQEPGARASSTDS